MPKTVFYLLTILCLTVTINAYGQSDSSPDFSAMSDAKLDSAKVLSQKIEKQYALFVDSPVTSCAPASARIDCTRGH